MDGMLYGCSPMALHHHRLLLLTAVVVVIFFLPPVFSQLPNICGTKANGRYACPDCSTSTTATSNRSASFQANLLQLHASLKDMAAADDSFLNATFTAKDSDTVYGLAMCFADAEQSGCSDCLTGAAAELAGTRCAGHEDMVLWYAHCLVRYNDTAFFGTADTSPAQRYDVPNPSNFSDPVSLGAARQRLAARMLPAAAASAFRFAFDAEEVTPNTTLHGLAQCTEDLPAEECSRCLASHTAWLAGCCARMNGVRLIGPSCYLRYEFMGFPPGTPPSMASLLPPAPASVPGTPLGRKKARIYILTGTLGALGLLSFFLGVFLCYKKRHCSLIPPMPWKRDTPNIESFLRRQHPRRYSYSQVKQMTKSFAHKLGQGGNGVVYKGTLPDGREIAVKMLKDNKDVDGEDFMTEVASISRTSHVNVVTLLGFCLQGRSKRALIYEFMRNGSLERYSFGQATEQSLGWETLFDIAVGIARGLEYLHRGCNAHIVHFDIKPHNILLDHDLRPKISDFGLAKLCPQKESTIAVSIAGARGTIGYIAPEVFSRGIAAVTSKSDVYSYGMMVLEMSGARRSMDGDEVPGSETSSSKYFPQCLYDGLDRFCARACEIDGEATGLVRKMVVVGLWCVQISPSDRPSMSRVVEMLEKSTEDLQLPPH
uniref:Uncharacterized protein n=1 Tax=Avena sativa TaxID=4498 RepID=A0ACD5WW94_AVESA